MIAGMSAAVAAAAGVCQVAVVAQIAAITPKITDGI
jgi:hypothetical protein